MADYTSSKPATSVYPDRAVDGQEWSRVEPLITPKQLKTRFLFGIPLVSYIVNPMTNMRDELSDEDLLDFINRAVAETELLTNLMIFPVQFDEKHPFDRNFWGTYGFVKVEHRPVMSVEKFAFTPATGVDIFEINKDWIESANFHKGQINLIPLVPAVAAQFISGSIGNASGSGFAYLNLIQGMAFVPAIIRIKYTAGFPGANVPRVLNELIGCIAGLEILNTLQITNKASSYSQGIDGISQSISTPGPQVYKPKIDFLMAKRNELAGKIKNIYGMGISAGFI